MLAESNRNGAEVPLSSAPIVPSANRPGLIGAESERAHPRTIGRSSLGEHATRVEPDARTATPSLLSALTPPVLPLAWMPAALVLVAVIAFAFPLVACTPTPNVLVACRPVPLVLVAFTPVLLPSASIATPILWSEPLARA